MRCLELKNNEYYLEDFKVDELARKFGTPGYFYSHSYLKKNIQDYLQAFSHYPTLICYAVKANNNLSILKEIFASGIGADIVSLGELEKALLAGCPADRIVFSGVGKTATELTSALKHKIKAIHVESLFELINLEAIAKKLNLKAQVALRLNLDIEAQTHSKISTGAAYTKFGIGTEELTAAKNLLATSSYLNFQGFALHLGSQIFDFSPLQKASSMLSSLIADFRKSGLSGKYIDLGGGLGVNYHDTSAQSSLHQYGQALGQIAESLNLPLVIEPGRSLVAESGVLLTSVLGIKKTGIHNFAVIDAGMNDLIRPAMYEAYHHILSAKNLGKNFNDYAPFDVVGPICETSDIMGKDRSLPRSLTAGDILIVGTCGAYGSSMASHYNCRPRAAEVWVNKNKAQYIRKPETMASLWQDEIISDEPDS